MTKWVAILCAALTIGLVVAACGGDDDDEGGGAAETEQPAETSGTAGGEEAGGGRTAEVSMKDIQFQPESVTIENGGTVTWTNDDSVGHDVTKDSGPGADFSSGDPGGLGPGDTYEHTFDRAGSYGYVCTVHPGMEGTVVVK